MLIATLLPGQIEDGEASLSVAESDLDLESPLVHTHTRGPQTWVNTDFYAQVSNVMPSGGVVLSPGQQLRIQEGTSTTEEQTQKTGKGSGGSQEAEKKQKELQFQLLVVDPDGSGYTTESNARHIITPPSAAPTGERYQPVHPPPVETKPTATREDNQSPYISPDSPQSQFFVPVADYTVVQELSSQHSLLLNPPPLQSPPPCLPQHPLKALPAMPVGYITPDLLGTLSPWNDPALAVWVYWPIKSPAVTQHMSTWFLLEKPKKSAWMRRCTIVLRGCWKGDVQSSKLQAILVPVLSAPSINLMQR